MAPAVQNRASQTAQRNIIQYRASALYYNTVQQQHRAGSPAVKFGHDPPPSGVNACTVVQ